jgi:hypothetical protein
MLVGNLLHRLSLGQLSLPLFVSRGGKQSQLKKRPFGKQAIADSEVREEKESGRRVRCSLCDHDWRPHPGLPVRAHHHESADQPVGGRDEFQAGQPNLHTPKSDFLNVEITVRMVSRSIVFPPQRESPEGQVSKTSSWKMIGRCNRFNLVSLICTQPSDTSTCAGSSYVARGNPAEP